MAEFSGLRSGWLKGRKGSVEGWFPEDFVMPVLSESGDGRSVREMDTRCQSADQNHVTSSHTHYTNLPAEYVTPVTDRLCVNLLHFFAKCSLLHSGFRCS